MLRNLKVLGLALIAALAMSAVAVNAALADLFYAEATPATLTGNQDGGTDSFWVDGGFANCSTVKYTGTTAAFGTSQITVTPSFSSCTFAGLVATVQTNGCDYLIKFNLTAGNTTAAIDIQCPPGKEMTVTAPSIGTPKCTLHIPSQTGAAGTVKGTNIGSTTTREVTLKFEHIISYSQTAGTAETGNCATADNTLGSHTGRALLTGENAAGTAHIGVFLA